MTQTAAAIAATQDMVEITDGTDDQRALTIADAQLPVIDLGPLLSGTPEGKLQVARELGKAARSSGFFYIVNHGVPQAVIDGVFEASKAFHSMTRSQKMRYWSGYTTHHRGYVPFEENGSDFPKVINFNEAWDMSFEAPADHPDHLAGWRMTGPNVWPDIPGWQDKVSAYYAAIYGLGHELLSALELELGFEAGLLEKYITAPTSQLRLLRYVENDLPANKDTVGIGAHSDFECFTILMQGGPGLQVMNADDYWMEAPPLPGAFIVNIGDVFETWSGGEFKSTQHRVVNIGRERYSFPLFFGLDYHATIEPLGRYRTPEALAKYPPIKAGEHLMRMSIKAFRYMWDAYQKGQLVPDYELIEENPFKRKAKLVNDEVPE